MIEIIGWTSSFILLLTLMRQVYAQWRTHATAGVSKWLFVGQLAASTGYIIYSYLLHNWVYVTSNLAILVTAFVGEAIYLRNRKQATAKAAASSAVQRPEILEPITAPQARVSPPPTLDKLMSRGRP